MSRWVAEAARRCSTRLALIDGARRWSWAELEREVAGCAGAMAALGPTADRGVGIVAANSAEVIFHWLAAGRLGVPTTFFNARLSPAELEVLASRAPLAAIFGPGRQGWLEGGPPVDARGASTEAVAAVLFTSGTTGTPKRVELTWAAFDASAEASAKRTPVDEHDRWLLTLPLFHVGGLAMVARWAKAGGVLSVEPGFDAGRVSEAIDAGTSQVSVVAVTLRRLLDHRGDRPAPPSVRAVLVGGGPVPAPTLARARALGFPVVQTYGLTEACSQVCTELLAEADGLTAGPPLEGTTVSVVDATGREVPLGNEGRIVIGGPTLARGLGPRHDTGDWGRLDARGRLTVLARRVDLIVSGGENVYPAEVEAVIESHPHVVECAVLPIAHDEWGQVGAAVVVGTAALDAAELERFVRARIAAFKVPKMWRFDPVLPRLHTGKLDRAALQASIGR